MEERFNCFRNNQVDPRALHIMVYDANNVAFAVRQLSQSSGKMALGSDGTNYQTLEPYSVIELAEIVKDRLHGKKDGLCQKNVYSKIKWEKASAWYMFHLG